MARLKGLSANLNAFLDMLSVSEGTSTSKLTKNDGYDVIVTGIDVYDKPTPEIFTDYSVHPFSRGRKSKRINKKGLTSNASGRYQFMLAHWPHYQKQLNLPDFGPESQDRWAIQLIRERKALPLIEAGKFGEAVAAVRNLWASLPGAGYGQPEHDLVKLTNVYLDKGGKLWASKSLSEDSSLQLSPYLVPLPTVSEKVEPTQLPKNELSNQQSTQNGLLNLLKKLLKRN